MNVPATLSMLPQLQCCQAAAEVADSRVRILDTSGINVESGHIEPPMARSDQFVQQFDSATVP